MLLRGSKKEMRTLGRADSSSQYRRMATISTSLTQVVLMPAIARDGQERGHRSFHPDHTKMDAFCNLP